MNGKKIIKNIEFQAGMYAVRPVGCLMWIIELFNFKAV